MRTRPSPPHLSHVAPQLRGFLSEPPRDAGGVGLGDDAQGQEPQTVFLHPGGDGLGPAPAPAGAAEPPAQRGDAAPPPRGRQGAERSGAEGRCEAAAGRRSGAEDVPDPVHNGAQSPQPDPQLAYQQLLCSDDGSTLVWPHFSDSSCTVETDYNEHELARLAGGAKGLVLEGLKWDVRYSYPEGMRFVSGECVAVATDQTGLWMPGGGQSMKITLDQCFGDEVEAAQERQMLLAVVLVLSSVCVCTGCCLYRCTRKQQQARGGGSFASSVRRYLAPPAVSYTPRPRPLSVDLCVYSSVSDTANDLLSCCFSWRR